MLSLSINQWLKVALFNFIIVAILGLLMRYKICYELSFLDQKNLQNAHSHFAFIGWVSQALIVLIYSRFNNEIIESRKVIYQNIFSSNLLLSYSILFSFIFSGYSVYSIILSTMQLLLMLYFFYQIRMETKMKEHEPGNNWINASFLFYTMSALGTFFLAYMAITKTLSQENYLGSIYWYLHFQYNGWFFFACMGLFAHYLHKNYNFSLHKSVFFLFFYSCIPLYGLSILWLNLSMALYIIVVVGVLMQTLGWIIFLKAITKLEWINKIKFLPKVIFYFLGIALCIKFTLQLFSVIPIISTWAFGYRPIVIAYLHLVLLAIISVFVLLHILLNNFFNFRKFSVIGLMLVLLGILLNEILLGAQGISSINYIIIPFINESLMIVSGLIIIGLILFLSNIKTNSTVDKGYLKM